MLKAKDITPGVYIMRNKNKKVIKRIWMGIIYGIEKEKGGSKQATKHIWFGNGQYNLDGSPHELDLIKRVA